ISEELLRVQLMIDDLHSQLKENFDNITKYKRMISPLKSLPNEIISKIFEEYAAGLPHPPWLVGHICSRWREIALSTPALW
ncbi:hypothetical protein BDZ94DRAFT_1121969, partial [Collybia nuda]